MRHEGFPQAVEFGLAGAGVEADPFLVSMDGRLAVGGTSSFEVRLLGPVQMVRAGREIELGGPRQRVGCQKSACLVSCRDGRLQP
jgi:hypothetical protein